MSDPGAGQDVSVARPAIATHTQVPGRRRRPSGEPPPLPRELNRIATAWLLGFSGWALIWIWVFLSDGPAIWITERDLAWMRPVIGIRSSWLTPTMQWINRIGTFWTTPIVGWGTIIGGLLARRIRHVILLIASLSTVAFIVTGVSIQVGRPRPLGAPILGAWEGFAQPSRPVALLTVALVGAGLTLIPYGRWRRRWFGVSAALIALFGFAQLYVAVDHPTDVLAAGTAGVAITLVVYRWGAPESVFPVAYGTGKTAHLDIAGARETAIRNALQHQLGIIVDDICLIGLDSSAGSTPLRITVSDGSHLFGKLYARSHLRSDRSYKLFRTLRYGRLEDEQRFTSVRRLVQHEDYLLRVMSAAEIPCMTPMGFVEITPDHEYLLVSEFIEGGVEIGQVELTVDLIDAALETVSRMWRAGLAHRDIKPANIMVQGDQLRLVDVAFGEVRPSPWRQAVDLANMMLVLALGSSPEIVYERAKRFFSEDEIAEAFAASRGVTLPSALRSSVRRDGRALVERFRDLAPRRKPVAIQRWSWRRLGLTLWVILVATFVLIIFLSSLHDIGLA